ncbi:MAG: DUF2515 family protein [Kofleriaceae bacterium]|nr:DUF2515 family protein [Myxococcales bacterium]MCB9559704.1 DUF2515 family protein [Kofleriaceae bacterium]MCB9573965.1 DUF2515 family protein [Kofleriaceae bacterium]
MPLDAWLAELDHRNRDNVARTASYLELYAWSRDAGCELPWVFMAHLVSRNAGYLMTDLARTLGRADLDAGLGDAMRNLFLLLERANWLIFWDAWHHTLLHLAGRTDQLAAPRTPVFMIDAWRRFEADAAAAGGAVDAALERRLVVELVHNEQHLIEHRVVHHPHLAPGRRLLDMVELSGREKPLHFPPVTAAPLPEIRVGGFAQLPRRLAAGARIFDEVLADRGRRDALFAWATAHPHTGSRAVYGGKPGPTLREAWPVDAVAAMWDGLHVPPAPDPSYP